MMMHCPLLYATASLLLQPTPPGPPAAIVLDGQFADWADIAPVVTDLLGDSAAPIDFGEVRVAANAQYVYLLVDIGNIENIQRLEGLAMIALNADGDIGTGVERFALNGVDLVVELSPHRDGAHPREHGSGVGVRSTTWQPDPADPNAKPLTPYDIGFTFAPTYASRVVEMRLDRGVLLPQMPRLFAGRRFSAKLVYQNGEGEVRDESPAFTVPLPKWSAPVDESETAGPDPLERSAGTQLRIATWNVEMGALMERPEPFVKILRALNADVLLLQELRGEHAPTDVQSLLNDELPRKDQPWHVVIGEGGNDLRAAIASRSPCTAYQPIQTLLMPGSRDRMVRAAGATIEVAGRRILLVSAHLKCCGQIGSREDETRQNEVEAIYGALAQARAAKAGDAVVVAGDLNLVGSQRPLFILTGALDPNPADDLAVVEALRLSGDSNGTWSDPRQPFVPGRLDLMTYSPAVLRPLGSFVFDARDLPKKWREKHGLQADDSIKASDHRPLVADFAWTEPR